jgi:hypothetical protein
LRETARDRARADHERRGEASVGTEDPHSEARGRSFRRRLDQWRGREDTQTSASRRWFAALTRPESLRPQRGRHAC